MKGVDGFMETKKSQTFPAATLSMLRDGKGKKLLQQR
jgi:hypothetical protein